MTPKQILAAIALVPIAALATFLLGDIPGVPPVPSGALGLIFIAGLVLTAQCVWLVFATWRTEGTALYVRDGGLAWSRSDGAVAGVQKRVRLQVAAGQAAVLERLGRFSRVLAPGTAQLLPGETVYRVVSTSPRTISGAVDCATKDGIPVEVGFEVHAQLQGAGPAESVVRPGSGNRNASGEVPGSPGAWAPESVARAAYEGGSWQGAVIALARSVIRDLIGRSYLSELTSVAGAALPGGTLTALTERARVRMANSAHAFGVGIPSMRMTAFRFPPALAEAHLAAWRPETPLLGGQTVEQGASQAETQSEMVLAPVIGRAKFTTIRKSLREAARHLVAPTAKAAGRPVDVVRMTGGPAAISMRTDSSLFAVEVRDSGFSDLGVDSGDLVVVEGGETLADGHLVMIVADERPSLRRCWAKPDHLLLTAASPRTVPIAVVEQDSALGQVAAFYREKGAQVDVRRIGQVRAIGTAKGAMRPMGAAIFTTSRATPLQPETGPQGVEEESAS